MVEFTLLPPNQVVGDDKLSFFKKYGVKCSATDFAILTGCLLSYNIKSFVDCFPKRAQYQMNFYAYDGSNKKSLASPWLLNVDVDNKVYYINYFGWKIKAENSVCGYGVRPAIRYSSVSKYAKKYKDYTPNESNLFIGEYPQTVVDKKLSLLLEKEYIKNSLIRTGRVYTSFRYSSFNKKERINIEYEYNGERFIRFISFITIKNPVLSNGECLNEGQAYWVKVEPINFLFDKNSDMALSQRILLSSVPFSLEEKNHIDYEKSFLKEFFDNTFSKEIFADRTYPKDKLNDFMPTFNYYNLNYDEVSEEEIIRGAVESNIPVFLHGLSGDGKSARVKQLDPNCKIIYLSHQTLDSFCGKSVYDQSIGKMKKIPPTWYEKVKEKCEKEPNKIHIIFFDELTNASPSIQNLIFNLVLDKELDGTWKLPLNVRIIAAGNEEGESLSAYQMPEPLFGRFAHVYIRTTVEEWLKWAISPSKKYERLDYKEEEKRLYKIHPLIYSFVAYKSYCGVNILRTPYNGIKPNVDPRKWEMASKMLYQTGKPEMLRSLIGEKLTNELIKFSKTKIITLDSLLNNSNEVYNLEFSNEEKIATVFNLVFTDIEYIEIVRNFIKTFGRKLLKTFESMWAHNDEERLKKILELRNKDEILEEKKLIKKLN